MPQTLADEISRFFDDYNRTFAERDGAGTVVNGLGGKLNTKFTSINTSLK